MEEQIRIPPITIDPTVVFFEDERPEEAKLYAEQKEAAREAWKNIIENENNAFRAAQFTLPGEYGQTLILSPSTRDGVDWQLSFFNKDGIPSMHEDYIADGTENPNRSRDNDMEALLRRLVNYSLHNREIIVTVAYEDKERESLMEKDIVKIQSAARSNFEGYVALAQFDRNKPNSDYKIYLGKRENYDDHGNYDNSDNSLVFVSNNEKLYGFLYGIGWVRTQQEMIDNGAFTAQDYEEYAQLKEGVLKQFEGLRTREVKFGIDIAARRQDVESGVPFRYPNWNQKQRLFIDQDGTLTVFTPQASTAPLYEQGYFLNLKPHEKVVEAIRYIIRNHPEIEVNLLSAYLDDSPYALPEKQAWMDKNLPEIDSEHRIFVPNGSDKKQFIGGLRPDDYLMDDYTKNLLRWEPGKGIKLLNAINHTRGTWQHDRIRYDRDPKDLANAILAVMQGREHIYDKRVEREAVMDKEERQFIENMAQYDYIRGANAENDVFLTYAQTIGATKPEAMEVYQTEIQRISKDGSGMRLVVLTSEEIGERYAPHDIVYNRLMSEEEAAQYRENPAEYLESIYGRLGNAGAQPSNYYGHSPSVGDAIVILTPEGAETHYVADIGFEKEADINRVMTWEQRRAAKLGMTVREEFDLIESINDYARGFGNEQLIDTIGTETMGRWDFLHDEYLPAFNLAEIRGVIEKEQDKLQVLYFSEEVYSQEESIAIFVGNDTYSVTNEAVRAAMPDVRLANGRYIYNGIDVVAGRRLQAEINRRFEKTVNAMVKENQLVFNAERAPERLSDGGQYDFCVRAYERHNTEDGRSGLIPKEIVYVGTPDMVEEIANHLNANSRYGGLINQNIQLRADMGLPILSGDDALLYALQEANKKLIDERFIRGANILAAMEAAGYHYDEMESRQSIEDIEDTRFVFHSETGEQMGFKTTHESEEWLGGVVFDDPEVTQAVEKIMHPERYETQEAQENKGGGNKVARTYETREAIEKRIAEIDAELQEEHDREYQYGYLPYRTGMARLNQEKRELEKTLEDLPEERADNASEQKSDVLDGLTERDMRQVIFEYETLRSVPGMEGYIPEADRMTRWYSEENVAVQKPFHGENQTPISQNMIAQKCLEILQNETREALKTAYDVFVDTQQRVVGLEIGGLAGRLQDRAAEDMNRQRSPWGSWFATISNPERPEDYIQLDITGYSTRNSVIESATLVLGGNVQDEVVLPEISFDDYGNDGPGFDTGFAQKVAELSQRFDPSLTSGYQLYAPAGWSDHSLDEHRNLLKENGYSDMPNWDVYNARVREVPTQQEQASPFIAHYYVVEDIQVRGPLAVQNHSDLTQALAAYAALPSNKMKALGIQNTNPLPGSLDIVQCKDGEDTLTNDWEKVEGWNNPEVEAAVQQIVNVIQNREAMDFLRMKQNILDGVHPEGISLGDGLTLEVLRDGNDNVVIDLRDYSAEDDASFIGGHSMSQDEFLKMTLEEFTETVRSIYANNMAIERRSQEEERAEEPLVDIYDLAYDDEGYLHFHVEADGYQLEGLYRVLDPANGEDMELVSIDYGDRHPIIERQWDRIADALYGEAYDRYNEMIDQRFEHKDRLVRAMALAGYVYNEQESMPGRHVFDNEQDGRIFVNLQEAARWFDGYMMLADHPLEAQMERILNPEQYESPIREGDEWYYNDPERGDVIAVHYNPDSNAGGQFVQRYIPYGRLTQTGQEAEGNEQRFFDILDEHTRYTELTDIDTIAFKEAVFYYKETPPDFTRSEGNAMAKLIGLASQAVERQAEQKAVRIGEYQCTKLDEWSDGQNSYLLGNSIDDNDFYYVIVNGKAANIIEYDKKPTREEVERDFINIEAARENDRHEAEFGSDGSRAFPNWNDDEAVFRLDGNQYLYIQESEDGYDYTIYDADMKELDGGQLDNLNLTMAQARTEILALHQMHPEKVERISIEEYERIGYEAERRNRPLTYSENEALVKLAERIDEFMYDYDYYRYADDVGIDLEARSEHRAHIANALENMEYSPMIDTFQNIVAEEGSDNNHNSEQYEQAKAILHDLTHLEEYQQSYGREAEVKEAAYFLDEETYLHVQTTEEGYDYTFYDKGMNEIDGGVLTVRHDMTPLTEARDIIIDSHAFQPKNIELVPEQEWEQLNEAIQQKWEEDRAFVELAQRLDQFAWNCHPEEASQSWNKNVRELAAQLKAGDVKDTLAWMGSGLTYLQNNPDPDNVAHMIREAKDLIYTVQHLDQFRQFYDRETAPNAQIPIREFTDNRGRTLEGSQISGMNIEPNTIGYADRAAVFNAVRDFEDANDLPSNQREIHNGTVEDKEFLYSGYDRHVGMSHRNDLSIQPYMERLTAMAEDKNKYISLLPLVAEIYYAQQNGLTPEQINYVLDSVQDDKVPLDAIKNLRHGFESGLNQEQMAVLAGENSFAQEMLMGYMLDGGSVEDAKAMKGCDIAQFYILSSQLKDGTISRETAQAIIQAVNGIKEWNQKDFDAQRDAKHGNPKWRFSQMDCEFFTEYLADQAAGDKSITPDMIADIGARFVEQRNTDNLRKFIEGNGGFHYFGDHREERSQEARLVDALRKYAGQDFLSYGIDASADFRAAADALENRADSQQKIPLVLIERLRNYSEHAFNQHDNYIAENLRDVADVLVKIREQNPEKDEPLVQTPEEKAVTEGVAPSPEKKDAKDLLNDQLQQGILNTLSSEGFKSWLDTNGKLFLNNYSFRNAVLVWMQKSDVSYTMGYEQWKQYGRNVDKGAQGIKIFVPVVAYEKKEGDLWNMIKRSLNSQMKANPSREHTTYRIGMSNMEVSLHKGGLYSLRINGKERGLKSEKEMEKFIKNNVLGKVPMYFTVGTVFDVKDTITPEYLWLKKGFTKDEMVRDEKGNAIKNKKGEYKIVNTPERQARFNTQLDMSVPQIDEKKAAILYESLKAVSERNGIHVYERDRKEDKDLKGADGYFSREFTDENPKGFIVMPTDLDPTKKVSVMLHEMSHSELHGDLTKLAQKMGEKNIPSDMREVQAEAVAYVVGKNFGIESGTSTFNYLAAYTKGFELQALSKSIEVIYNECRQLTNELKTELEARGLNMDLSERQQPMGKEAVQTVSKAYASYVVEQNERIAVIEKELQPLAEQNKGKDAAISALVAQGLNIKRQKEDIGVIEEKITALEAAQTLPEQMGCIQQIDAAKNRIEDYKKDFSDLTAVFQEAVHSEQSLKGRFVADPVATIKDMGKNMDYVQLGALSDAQVQYLAKSEYVSAELAPLLRNDPAQFEEKAYERATQIDKVASKNGIFVEVTFCEQWTDTPIVENGALMHPKVADTIVKQAETQIRGLRQQADSVGDYFPYAKCDLMIYQAKKGEITTAYKTRVDIGDGSQGSLVDHLKHISSAKDITPEFEKATRERGAKDKIVFNATPEQDVQVQEKPTREAMPSDRGMSREDWMQEINERREAEKSEGGQHQQEHTDRPKSAKRDLEHG